MASKQAMTCILAHCTYVVPGPQRNPKTVTPTHGFLKKTAVCILVGVECTKAWHMKNHLATCHRHQAFVAGIVNSHLICGGLAVCDIF